MSSIFLQFIMFHFTALGDGLMNCSTKNGQRFFACDKIEKWMVGFEIVACHDASLFANDRGYISKYINGIKYEKKKTQNKKKVLG